jgi:hypothetical protein
MIDDSENIVECRKMKPINYEIQIINYKRILSAAAFASVKDGFNAKALS